MQVPFINTICDKHEFMDSELVCNFKKCRKRLSSHAWVTSCSHIFCDEDGTREFNKNYSCPACETSLSGKFDIIRIDLQPTEQYKSMVLAGQKPEVIMEICNRALSFWTYQAHQERTYQEYLASKAKEKAVQLEQYYEQIVSRTHTELTSLKTQLSTTKKDVDATKKKYNEISDKLNERNRQYQKLQSLYDALRRKCITPSSFEGDGDLMPNPSSARVQNFMMPMTTGEDVLGAAPSNHLRQSRAAEMQRLQSPPEKDFILRPNNTPLMRPNSSQNLFELTMRTPNGSSRHRPP